MAFLATRFEMQARGTGVSPRGLLVTGSQPPPEWAHGISVQLPRRTRNFSQSVSIAGSLIRRWIDVGVPPVRVLLR
jgi:hypothetical protein